MKKQFTILSLGLSALLLSNTSFAETRQHEAHVHGHGKLNFVLTDQQVHIELETPSDSIFGFEHHPETEEEMKTVEVAHEILENGAKLFQFPKKAECSFTSVSIESAMLEDEEHEHKDHDEHKDGDHEHDEHPEKHEHSEGHEHEDHDHEGHKGETHSDVTAQYQFTCKDMKQVTSIQTTLFAKFPRFDELDAQLVTPQGARAFELSAKNSSINLK